MNHGHGHGEFSGIAARSIIMITTSARNILGVLK